MTETTPTATSEVSGARAGAEKVFAYLAALMLLGVIVQFFLAGLGVFSIAGHKKLDDVSGLDPHRAVGSALALVALLMLIAALVARASRQAWVSLALLVLILVVQTALAAGGDTHHWLGGLHALDGVIILGLAGWMHRVSRDRLGFMK